MSAGIVIVIGNVSESSVRTVGADADADAEVETQG